MMVYCHWETIINFKIARQTTVSGGFFHAKIHARGGRDSGHFPEVPEAAYDLMKWVLIGV